MISETPISPEAVAVASDFARLLDMGFAVVSAIGTAGGVVFLLFCAADIVRRWTLRSDSKWKF